MLLVTTVAVLLQPLLAGVGTEQRIEGGIFSGIHLEGSITRLKWSVTITGLMFSSIGFLKGAKESFHT